LKSDPVGHARFYLLSKVAMPYSKLQAAIRVLRLNFETTAPSEWRPQCIIVRSASAGIVVFPPRLAALAAGGHRQRALFCSRRARSGLPLHTSVDILLSPHSGGEGGEGEALFAIRNGANGEPMRPMTLWRSHVADWNTMFIGSQTLRCRLRSHQRYVREPYGEVSYIAIQRCIFAMRRYCVLPCGVAMYRNAEIALYCHTEMMGIAIQR